MSWKPTTVPGRPPAPCVDCCGEISFLHNYPSAKWRPTNHAKLKPRCATHQRETHNAAKANNRTVYQQRVYNMDPETHHELLIIQGFKCWICQVATGRAKALATDHNHACCNGPTSCGECVRGKLCGPCNELIGRFGVESLLRAIGYLRGDTPMARLRLQRERMSA